MNKNCIINVASGDYVRWQKRLVESSAHGAFAFPGVDVKVWTDTVPPGARSHHESLYGFKPHAFLWAFEQGYENVLWLDAPCYLVKDPAPVFEVIERTKTYLIHGEDRLTDHVNKKCLDEFVTSKEVLDYLQAPLLSGSCIGVSSRGKRLIDDWARYETENWFTSNKEDMVKTEPFRHDETILSLLVCSTIRYETTHYQRSFFQNGKNSIILCEKTPEA